MHAPKSPLKFAQPMAPRRRRGGGAGSAEIVRAQQLGWGDAGLESEPSIVDGAVDPCAGSASVATSMNAGGNHGAAAPYDKEESVSGVSRVRQPHESCAVAMEVGGEGGVSDAAACGPLGPGAIQGPTRPVSMRHLRVRVQQWGVQVRLRQCCNRMAVCRRLRQRVLLVF